MVGSDPAIFGVAGSGDGGHSEKRRIQGGRGVISVSPQETRAHNCTKHGAHVGKRAMEPWLLRWRRWLRLAHAQARRGDRSDRRLDGCFGTNNLRPKISMASARNDCGERWSVHTKARVERAGCGPKTDIGSARCNVNWCGRGRQPKLGGLSVGGVKLCTTISQ